MAALALVQLWGHECVCANAGVRGTDRSLGLRRCKLTAFWQSGEALDSLWRNAAAAAWIASALQLRCCEAYARLRVRRMSCAEVAAASQRSR